MSDDKQLATAPKKPELVTLIEAKLPDITAALPPNTVKAAQLQVAFVAALNKKPDLRLCTPTSFCAALVNCAALGIIPETPEQHAFLIPRNRKLDDDTWVKEVELQICYRGFVHLIIRGDRRRVVLGDVVHQGDEFQFENGTNIVCRHVPNLSDPARRQKPVIAAWALIKFPDGQQKLEVMDGDDLRKIEKAMLAQNKNKMSPAWAAWPTEMMRKAPIKRMAKTSDLGPEIALAADLDNQQFAALPSHEAPKLILPGGETIDANPPQPQLDERDPNTGEYKF